MTTEEAKPESVTARRTPIAQLKPHPRNYRTHPHAQLEHIAASIRANGFYRNVVCARDHTILAGHGTVEAAKLVGMTHVPVVTLDLDPLEPAALKVLAGDNEIMQLVESDDYALAGLLKDIASVDVAELLGTGYDAASFAALVKTMPVVPIATSTKHDDETQHFDDFPPANADDRFVLFVFGDYRGRVSREVYDAFIKGYRGVQATHDTVLLDDVLRAWLNV